MTKFSSKNLTRGANCKIIAIIPSLLPKFRQLAKSFLMDLKLLNKCFPEFNVITANSVDLTFLVKL